MLRDHTLHVDGWVVRSTYFDKYIVKTKKKYWLTFFGGMICGAALLSIACYVVLVMFITEVGEQLLGPPPKPPVGIVGSPMNKDTQSSYDFLCRTTGLSFPKGTIIDAYDTGFDLLIACLTCPNEAFKDFVEDNQLQLRPSSGAITLQGIDNLSEENQSIPSQISLATKKDPPDWEYPLRMYINKESRKIWIELHYKGWFD